MLVIHVGLMLVSDFTAYNPGSEMCSAAVKQMLEQDVYHSHLSLWFNSGLSCKYVTVSLGKPRTAFEEQASTLLGSSSTSGIYAGEYETLQSDLHSCHGKSIIKVWSIYLPDFFHNKKA